MEIAATGSGMTPVIADGVKNVEMDMEVIRLRWDPIQSPITAKINGKL